ncbi:MAG: bacteriohemerythrin [Deltaproteobacteria bacterium]|nr:bacteriohemerythrin [Deltaproteobacteria bacterium]
MRNPEPRRKSSPREKPPETNGEKRKSANAHRATPTKASPRVRAANGAKARSSERDDYLISLMKDMEQGNMCVEIDAEWAERDPVVGAFASLLEATRAGFVELTFGSRMTERASSTMNDTAKAVRENAANIRQHLSGVLSATEEMRLNMNSVSASTEELSANMKSIADAATHSEDNFESVQGSIQELTTASREIAANSARASMISREAMESVTAALALVNELTASAKDIDVVTSAISEISDQTKLLALNATIESARAGEMGKGFAVVAKEVKELASQTHSATKDIQSKISIIHEVTLRTVEAMTTVSREMKNVNEAITTIAAASEEQSVTTGHIAHNVVDATERIKEMSANVSEGALAVQDVSRSIVGTTRLSNSVATAVNELERSGASIEADAVTSYAQALEVLSHGGDVVRRLRRVRIPEDARRAADATSVELCRFSDDYDVRVMALNDDHKKIFAYINELHRRIKEKAPADKLVPTFRDLAEFTRAHFAREEETMVRAHYPDLDGHRRIHATLLQKVAEIQNGLESGKGVDLIEVLGFLRDWLVTHIMGVDRKYSPVMNQAGIF